MSIGVKGWFDQSSMKEPMLRDARWQIDDSKEGRVIESKIRRLIKAT